MFQLIVLFFHVFMCVAVNSQYLKMAWGRGNPH